jgi:hypothetical protein
MKMKTRVATYVFPNALANSPEYAKRVVDSGINTFIVRAGFDVTALDPHLDKAVKNTMEAGATLWFLLGTWWGNGVEPKEKAMRPLSSWPSYGSDWAYESSWKMYCPGEEFDLSIVGAAKNLIQKYSPEAIILTHARFRHPADFNSLFEIGSSRFIKEMNNVGIDQKDLLQSIDRILAVLPKHNSQKLSLMAQSGLISFLETLSESQTISQWFTFRSRQLEAALTKIAKSIKNGASKKIRVGLNQYGPIASDVCGPDHDIEDIDVIQPLLCYIRLHSLQLVGSWARLMVEIKNNMNEAEAIKISASLFRLTDVNLPLSLQSYANKDESSPEIIREICNREISLLHNQKYHTELMPVIRGREWPVDVMKEMTMQCSNMTNNICYQGTEYKAGHPPCDGWY